MNSHRRPIARDAFSLIELVGLLTVIGIFTAILMPFLIRKIDQVVSDREIVKLNALESALHQSIMRNGYIPDDTDFDWAYTIGAELGVDVSGVTNNARGQPRILLIDPALEIGSPGGRLPYTQTNFGSRVFISGEVVAPKNPRLMIVTSLGRTLSGVNNSISASDFNAIWNTLDGTLPTPLAGWGGDPWDLKIKRMNLSGLFVRLLLATNASPTTLPNVPRFSVREEGYESAAPVEPGTRESYYIKNSTLRLFNHTGTADSQQIMNKDASYVYDQYVWRGSIGATAFVGGMDVGSVVDQFLKAPQNPNAYAPATQQADIVSAMIAFFEKYDVWAASGFTTGRDAAVAAQSAMMSAVQGLYYSQGGFAPPLSNDPDVPCP